MEKLNASTDIISKKIIENLIEESDFLFPKSIDENIINSNICALIGQFSSDKSFLLSYIVNLYNYSEKFKGISLFNNFNDIKNQKIYQIFYLKKNLEKYHFFQKLFR